MVVKSVKYVPSCPTSKVHWDKAASKKRCGEKARQQNCTTKKYEYHCVINEYRNATLEVCAPQRLILGNTYIYLCTILLIHCITASDFFIKLIIFQSICS